MTIPAGKVPRSARAGSVNRGFEGAIFINHFAEVRCGHSHRLATEATACARKMLAEWREREKA